jgi:Xaa-Pro aminopeptidase
MLLNRVRAEEKMDEHNLEALIATSPANVFYMSDCYPYGRSFVVLPRERDLEPAMVAPISGTTPIVLMSPPWIRDIRYYGEFYVYTQFVEDPNEEEERLIQAQGDWEKERNPNPTNPLIEVLKSRGIKGRIGVDESGLGYDDPLPAKIELSLQRTKTVPASDILRKIRMVKTEEEIRRIREAVRITEKGWETALRETIKGISEIDFAHTFQEAILSEGGHNFSYLGRYWPPIAFGRRTAFSDIAQPTGNKLKEGDIIRFDGGCTHQGYPCDMARAAVLGEPNEKLERYWNAIYEGEQAAIEMVKPGPPVSEIFNTAVETVREKGIPHYKRHHTGHGWGIEGYDPPTVGPNDAKLEEGMILCFETPYYEVGWGGILHEDVILVTERGPEYLTKPETELRQIE